MRTLLLTAACVLFVGPAFAGPLDGRWAWEPEDCFLEPGSSDSVPTIITGNRIDYYESTCTILSMEAIGTQESAWNVSLACMGEGETSNERAIFALDRDESGKPLQWIEIDIGEGFVTVRQSCD